MNISPISSDSSVYGGYIELVIGIISQLTTGGAPPIVCLYLEFTTGLRLSGMNNLHGGMEASAKSNQPTELGSVVPKVVNAKLVNISPIPSVYGGYIDLVTAGYVHQLITGGVPPCSDCFYFRTQQVVTKTY